MWYEKLLPEQREAADFILLRIRDGGGVGLFSEQGTGKTIVSLAVMEQLQLDDVLIICPLTAVETTWVPRLAASGAIVCRSLEDFKRTEGCRRILVIHFQLMSAIIAKLARMTWSLVVIDESQGLKARSTGWSRSARKLRRSYRRLALSGTPIDKSPIDVFGQMRFIDHNVLGENWTPFAERFCRKGGYMGRKWEFNERQRSEFLEVLKPYIYRLSAAFLNLPKMYVHPIPVSLLGDQRKAYESMARDSIVCLESDYRIKADLPITRNTKLEQIVNGFIIDDEGGTHIVGHAKERKLRWLLKRLPAPVVICCKFLHDVATTSLIAGDQYGKVEAIIGATRNRRTVQIRDFQAGRIPALVLQIRTGGVSIELTKAAHLVVYSMGHSYIDFDQLIKRLMRYGQDKEVHVYLLYVTNTVDEEKISVVEQKAQEANFIVSHFERNHHAEENHQEDDRSQKDRGQHSRRAPVRRVARS